MFLNAGPYAWVQHTPGKPISPNNPNEGSVKRRNEKKRMRQRRAFILVCSSSENVIWTFELVFEVDLQNGIERNFVACVDNFVNE